MTSRERNAWDYVQPVPIVSLGIAGVESIVRMNDDGDLRIAVDVRDFLNARERDDRLRRGDARTQSPAKRGRLSEPRACFDASRAASLARSMFIGYRLPFLRTRAPTPVRSRLAHVPCRSCRFQREVATSRPCGRNVHGRLMFRGEVCKEIFREHADGDTPSATLSSGEQSPQRDDRNETTAGQASAKHFLHL